LTFGVALAVTALAIIPAGKLRIRTDVEAMLPNGAPAAEAYRTFLDTFGGIEKVFITVRLPDGATPDPERLADAADALAAALAPSPEVRRVRAGLDDADEDYVVSRLAPSLPLLVPGDAAAALAPRLTDAALAERAAALKDAAAGPGSIFLSRVAAADPLDLAGVALAGLSPAGSLPFDPVTGAILSRDQRAALVIVTPLRGETDTEGGRELVAALDAAFAATRRAVGDDLRFEALGGPLYAMHDKEALKDDLIRILGAASVLVFLMIILAFEGFSIPAISIAAVALGQIWCAALVAMWLGSVTAVGVGFAAILLGLGDDFTIHLAARFREACAQGLPPAEAMEHAVDESGPGITSAALTTAAAFACLGLASFRPLRELGLVVAAGVILLWFATLTAAAPMLLVAARRWKPGPRPERRRGFGWLVEAGVRAGTARPFAALAVCGALTILGAAGAARLTLDTELRRLRPSDHPTVRAETALIRDFGLGIDTSTVTVAGAGVDDALDRADAVAALARVELPGAEVASPSDWLVTGERLAARLKALAPLKLDDVASRFSRALDREGLDPRAFAPALDGMRTIAGGRAPSVPPSSERPDWINEGIRTSDGGTLVAVRIRLPEGAWPDGPPAAFLAKLDAAAPGSQLANAKRLGAELRVVAIRDVTRLGALAAIVVLALVAISYRGDAVATVLTFLPVVVGTVCTAGLWGWFGRPLDLFSMCVLPVMIGIGMDDGLHVLHMSRYRGEDLARATSEAGRGIVLTNLTTCAGFASLMLSHVPALRNGGLLICVGNLLCLAATLVALPAIAALRRSR
jgi:predicted RND superfamily exporter protein